MNAKAPCGCKVLASIKISSKSPLCPLAVAPFARQILHTKCVRIIRNHFELNEIAGCLDGRCLFLRHSLAVDCTMIILNANYN